MRKTSRVKKSIMMMAITLMMIVTGLGIAQKNALASSSDEAWSFSLSVNSSVFRHMTGREKENSTKIYIYWSATYGGDLSQIKVYACGASGPNGTPVNASRSDPSANPIYGFMYGAGQYSLTNYVYEINNSTAYKGTMPYARPGLKSNAGSGAAQGWWSPDSIGSYTVIP